MESNWHVLAAFPRCVTLLGEDVIGFSDFEDPFQKTSLRQTNKA